jgi:hypothetical protein
MHTIRSLASICILLFVSGCGSVPQPAVAPAREVHLVVANLSDFAWQITFAPRAGGAVRVLHLAARESQRIDLAGGTYSIEQIALNESGAADSTRRFAVNLESGQTYRWRLATLLSGEAEGTLLNDKHERGR